MDARAELEEALACMPRVRLGVLFGSAARDGLRSDRDLDVGVLLDADEPGTDTGLRVALERCTGRRVDLHRLDRAPPLLRFEIAREGLALVERNEGDWARFRARAMIDWWDWAPTARMMHHVTKERLEEEAPRGAT